MEVLHSTAVLGEPNKCIICDETPHLGEQRVIDTGQTMVAPFSDNVWRKYVCERCGLEIANKLGFVSNEQAKAAYHAAEAATTRLTGIRDIVNGIAESVTAFAADIDLGTERAKVARTVEGDYIAPSQPPASEKKESAPRKKVASGSTPASGQS